MLNKFSMLRLFKNFHFRSPSKPNFEITLCKLDFNRNCCEAAGLKMLLLILHELAFSNIFGLHRLMPCQIDDVLRGKTFNCLIYMFDFSLSVIVILLAVVK